MYMSEGQEIALLAILFLLLLFVVTVLWLAIRGVLNLLDPPAPDPTPYGKDTTQAGKWVLLGLLLLMLASLFW